MNVTEGFDTTGEFPHRLFGTRRRSVRQYTVKLNMNVDRHFYHKFLSFSLLLIDSLPLVEIRETTTTIKHFGEREKHT